MLVRILLKEKPAIQSIIILMIQPMVNRVDKWLQGFYHNTSFYFVGFVKKVLLILAYDSYMSHFATGFCLLFAV